MPAQHPHNTEKIEAKGKGERLFLQSKEMGIIRTTCKLYANDPLHIKTRLLGRSQDKDLEMAVLFLSMFWSVLFICHPLPVPPLPPGLLTRCPWEGWNPTVMPTIPQGPLDGATWIPCSAPSELRGAKQPLPPSYSPLCGASKGPGFIQG